MGRNVVHKILKEHLIQGELKTGEEIDISVDQVLMQDATGTMAWLQFEAIGMDAIQVPLAVSYVDHNILQIDNLNPDDHLYLQSVSARYGACFSRAGNGICHQVHLERFAKPGAILIGSDSHTPTAGGIGSIAIGVGGMNIASTLAGEPFTLVVPEVVKVVLEGELRRPWVSAMDVVLELLRRLTVKGGVGKIFEYTGPGLKSLTVTERATITNFGAELGATTSIFPADENTLHYLKAQDRKGDFKTIMPDKDAEYEDEIVVDMSKLKPLVAKPHSPDNVVSLSELIGLKVDQVAIGSCTNSSYQIMKGVASLLEGNNVYPSVSMTISPGSKQVFEMMAKEGDLQKIISAGARVLELACGPCIGMGQAPPSGGVTFRSFNRNFKGRSGTTDANIYLTNPFVCTLIGIKGEVIDPSKTGIAVPAFKEPEKFLINDNSLLLPPSPRERSEIEVKKGPNIKEVPTRPPLEDNITARVLLRLGDNISTDDILPAGAEILPLRSNIPEISKFVFFRLDSDFYKRAKNEAGGFIVGGENYGQGSSREHAALAPMFLGIKAVFAKSFARIHRANLINFGILPVVFKNPDDISSIEQGDLIEIYNIHKGIEEGMVRARIKDKNREITFLLPLSIREKQVIKAGGLLNWLRSKKKGEE